MESISSTLNSFIQEYHELYKEKVLEYEDSFLGDIKKIRDKLLDERFLPYLQLKQVLDKQIRRARYPMEVAITGQFSSGKSTFLNALLSKDILPTGITPVTSKVNFINYAPEYKLKVTYNSGAQEFHAIESIATFTDQRVTNIDDIKYLTIYAPLDILKDISFVDTPGLNSQSNSDTQTTKNILRDVGGIIWLSMIDNAGKLSEEEVLNEYMPHFATKSLCVLNHKDKFTPEQVQTTKKYIQEKFSKYFTQVSAISAKMALDARALQKHILIEDSLQRVIKDFTADLKENVNASSLDFFEDNFSNFRDEIKQIQTKGTTKNKQLIEESNIQEVLDFIHNIMRPNAKIAKENAIKKDIKNMCDILHQEYETMLGIYDSLCGVLYKLEEPTQNALNAITKNYSYKLQDIYNSLLEVMQEIAQEIYTNIKSETAIRYETSQSKFFKQENIQKFDFNTFWIDSDTVYKNLFFDENRVQKLIKRSLKQLTLIESDITNSFENVYAQIHVEVSQWQKHYQLIKKSREIASDLEFSNIRRFASQTHENILNSFHISFLDDIFKLKTENAHFSATITHSNQQKVQATIVHFVEKIKLSEDLHKKDPSRFDIQQPREDEILEKLKENFGFLKIEKFLNSNRNYLFKIIKNSKQNYLELHKQKLEFVQDATVSYKKKISVLSEIKESI
ncbi:dynamin family protein [Sulfurimonas sp. SAG-AH-194-C21]|nr:dynamin family protein [Sulfurimonas sp. SAG-AH-194-C21]MDF1883934.1 dynamin family protein [Sulfurimonas sp. SAG-AH-194-C21]